MSDVQYPRAPPAPDPSRNFYRPLPSGGGRDFDVFIVIMALLALTIGAMVVLGCDPLGCH